MMQSFRSISSIESLRALCGAFSTSALAGAASGSGHGGHPYRMYDDLAQQTYVISSARHSMRDPVYVSISDPVYELPSAAPQPASSSSGSQGLRMMDDYSSQTYVYSAGRHSMHEPRYISISEPAYDINTKGHASTAGPNVAAPGTVGKASQPQHPYRMLDDYAQQTYTISSNRHSMREPRYVSISEPAYDIGGTAVTAAQHSAGTKAGAPGPNAARMYDDYAQVTYVFSASRHSMREPVYHSLSDPVYDVGGQR